MAMLQTLRRALAPRMLAQGLTTSAALLRPAASAPALLRRHMCTAPPSDKSAETPAPPDFETTPGMKFVYYATIGQSYRIAAASLNLFAYASGTPLLPFLGTQPIPTADWILPFCIDFTVGASAPIIAGMITSSPSPQLYGLLVAWVTYGWLDHVFAVASTCFGVSPFGPFPMLGLGELGFSLFTVASSTWQGTHLYYLLTSPSIQGYFGLKTK